MLIKNALQFAIRLMSQNLGSMQESEVLANVERILHFVLEQQLGKKLSRLDFYSLVHYETLNPEAWQQALRLLEKRAQGYPLQYLTGSQAFLDHDYEVGPGVLIPRPETEVLVTEALSILSTFNKNEPKWGWEIGLGSGIISIELLHHFPLLQMWASEWTDQAYRFAEINAERILGFEDFKKRFKIIRPHEPLEVFEPFTTEKQGRVDFIISNPPYLTLEQGHSGGEIQSEVLKYEPREALLAPEADSLYFYRKIAEEGKLHLKPGGWVFLEVPHERARLIEECFLSLNWNELRWVEDLTGRQRVLIARKPQ